MDGTTNPVEADTNIAEVSADDRKISPGVELSITRLLVQAQWICRSFKEAAGHEHESVPSL